MRLYAALLGKLRAGVRCFVASNSANAAHMLERLIRAELPQLQVLCISQETGSDPAVVQTLSDMNALRARVRLPHHQPDGQHRPRYFGGPFRAQRS